MSNGSPTAYLLWAILSCIYLVFFLLHLWNYDRFACLRWNAGRQPGAFKRVMTYSYLATVPLLVAFSLAITVLKFKEGFIVAFDGTITPRPFSMWSPSDRRWVLPLDFVLGIAWSLEHVTHLEELTFWVFLLTQGPNKREWFNSWEYRVWTLGSITSVAGMPTTVIATRYNIDTCLAYIFLVGSVAGTATTVCFLYVLARFPSFIAHVKTEGAEPDVVVRLATFYQLNLIRVAFRFLFTLPLMIIGVDALQAPFPIINNPFAFDFLLMMGAIGCTVSSAITLLVFFPRSITSESGHRTKARSHSYSQPHSPGHVYPHGHPHRNQLPMYGYTSPETEFKPHAHGDSEFEHEDQEYYVYGEEESQLGSVSMIQSPTSAEGDRGEERGVEMQGSTSGEGGYDPEAESPMSLRDGQGRGSALAAVSSEDTVWDRGGVIGIHMGTALPHSPSHAHMGWGRQREHRRSVSLTGEQAVVPLPLQQETGLQKVGDGSGTGTMDGEDQSAQSQSQSPQPSTDLYPLSHRRLSGRVTSGKRRRHHSGGPFFFDTGGYLVGPQSSADVIREESPTDIDMSVRRDERGVDVLERVLERRRARAREREARERAVEQSALHPYVINWTSPIDLHDGVHRGREWRGKGRTHGHLGV